MPYHITVMSSEIFSETDMTYLDNYAGEHFLTSPDGPIRLLPERVALPTVSRVGIQHPSPGTTIGSAEVGHNVEQTSRVIHRGSLGEYIDISEHERNCDLLLLPLCQST